MLRLILLITSLCAVAPASATPARFSSPNIASSILHVGEFTANERERAKSSEEVRPDRSPAADRAVRELERKFLGDANKPLLAPDPPHADFRAARPIEKPQDKKALVPPPSANLPDFGQLQRTYDNDTRTYQRDAPQHLWAKEPNPPLEVEKDRTKTKVYDFRTKKYLPPCDDQHVPCN
jgi:hypothetical protein